MGYITTRILSINKFSLFLLATMLLGLQTSAWAQSGFGDETTMVEVSGRILDSDLADIDGDGDLDVVIFNNGLAWIENNGDGTFGTRTKINSSGDTRTYPFISAADMDNDGDIDVAAGSDSFNRIIYYINTGDGSFEEVEYQITGSISGFLSNIYTVDIDGDGDTDLFSSAYGNADFGFYENDGAGEFGDMNVILDNTGSDDMIAADLNFDGQLDLISASQYDDKLAFYLNGGSEGAASFPNESIIFSEKNYHVVAVADIDGDNVPDVISGAGNQVAFYPNQGDGSFVAGLETVISANANGVNDIVATDLNGDDLTDIIFTAPNRNEIIWMMNTGGGTEPFQTPRVITNTALDIKKLHLADMNGDGHADIIAQIGTEENIDKLVWFQNDTENIVSFTAPAPPYEFGDVINYNGDFTELNNNQFTEPIGWVLTHTNPPGSGFSVQNSFNPTPWPSNNLRLSSATINYSAGNAMDIEASNEPINVAAGDLYEASIWFNATTEGNKVQMYLKSIDDSDTTRYADSVLTLETGWTNYALRYEATAAQAEGQLRFGIAYNFEENDGNIIYAGDLQISKIDPDAAVSNETEELPGSFTLHQNYPNPFNPTTRISFELANSSLVSLTVYDILGQEVTKIISHKGLSRGSHSYTFNASELTSGVYIYRLQSGSYTQTRKMTLIK